MMHRARCSILLTTLLGCIGLFAQPAIGQDLQEDRAAAQKENAQPAPAQPAAAQPGTWTTQWSFQDIDIARLASRLASIGIELPVQASGDVSVEFEVSIPMRSLRDGKAYRLDGRLRAKRLTLEQLLLEDFAADVLYENGVLSLRDVTGRWMDASTRGTRATGSFAATSRLQLLPVGDAEVELKADSLAAAPLVDLITKATGRSELRSAQGIVSGDLKFTSPVDSIRDVATWEATADFQIRDFQIASTDSIPLSIDTGPVVIGDGRLDARDVTVTSAAAPEVQLDVTAQLELIDQQRFAFQVRGNDVPIDSLSEIVSATAPAPLASGKLDLDATGTGRLSTMTWNVGGRIGSPAMTVLGQNLGLLEHRFTFDETHFELLPINEAAAVEAAEMIVKRLSADYQWDPEKIQFSDLSAQVFGGQVEGQASLPRNETGRYDLNLSWRDLSPTLSTAPVAPVSLGVTASTSGSIQWSVDAQQLSVPAAHRGTLSIRMADLTIGGASVGQANVDVVAGQDEVRLDGSGALFGGTFEVETRSAVKQDDDWQSFLGRIPLGTMKVSGARFDKIMPIVRPRDSRRYSGTWSTVMTLRPSAQHAAQAGLDHHAGAKVLAEFEARSLAINGDLIARRLAGKARWIENVIVIDRASGSYAGGRMTADGRWSLGGGSAGRQLNLRFSGIEACDSLRPLGDSIAQRVGGIVSGRLTIAGETDFRIQGNVSVRESSLFSIATGTVTSGVSGSFSGSLERWELKLPSIVGELAGGQVTGRAEVSSTPGLGGAFDLSSRLSARRVDFGMLAAQTGTVTSLAHGRISGTLSLGGKRIRGAGDLVGDFQADLGQTDAAAIPGLLDAGRFLGAISLVGTRFQDGVIRGRITGGAVQIQEFSLRADRVRVFAQGRVGISDLRMDLQAVIATGSLDTDNAKLLAIAGQMAIDQFIPVSLIVEINRLFSNRTIYLDVLGTINRPQLRLKPLEIIRQEAARFLVREVILAINAGDSSVFD